MADDQLDCINNRLEIRGFGKLRALFAERHWSYPYYYAVNRPITGKELLDELAIGDGQVEALMINGLVQAMDKPMNPGDRVALVPPGTPGPYRVLLGFVDRTQSSADQSS